jgi:hypothetical protein
MRELSFLVYWVYSVSTDNILMQIYEVYFVFIWNVTYYMKILKFSFLFQTCM